MADLPAIPALAPVTIDSLPTSYPSLFMSDLRIKAAPGVSWRAVFERHRADGIVEHKEIVGNA